MAWCPHCSTDRPIRREALRASNCPYCRAEGGHRGWCRGRGAGAVDVCSYCDTALFARALDASSYASMLAEEERGRADYDKQLQEVIEQSDRREG